MTWAPDYCTAVEFKGEARIDDTVDDTQIGYAITAASRAVDRATGRQFGVTSSGENRVYTARWDRQRRRHVVDVDDFQTTTGLAIAFDLDDDQTFESSLVAGDWRLWPLNASSIGVPWTRLIVNRDATYQPNRCEGAVQVTATWGWTAVPTTIKQATILQASRFLARRDSPFGIAGSPNFGGGGELRLLDRVDPDVAVMVRVYRRNWAAV